MFYSKLLLSKKGGLNTIWVAAHCFNKLNRNQLLQTNISSSVDKIIHEEVPVAAHRILAFLLLGVVRIYSKKLDYLLHDCQEILNKLCDFNITNRARSGTRVTRRLDNSTIILPLNFELDAFDLDIVEDRDLRSRNNRPREQLMLTDGRREEGSTSGLPYMENMSVAIAGFTASTTPPRDVLSLHNMDQDCFMIPFKSMKSSIVSCETSFPLEDCLGPMLLDEEEEERLHLKPFNERLAISHKIDHEDASNASSNKGDTVSSLEIITETGARSGQCLDVIGLCGSENESLDDMVLDNSENEPLISELFNNDIGVTGACSGQSLDDMVLYNGENETLNNTPCNENIGVMVEVTHELNYSDRCLGVRMLTATENGQPYDVSSNKEFIIEDQDNALDNRVNPRLLTVTENGQACDVSSNIEPITAEEFVNHKATKNLHRFVYTRRKVGAKKIKIPELITQESRNGKTVDVRPVSIDVTPDSKLAGVSDATPGIRNQVQTPAPTERNQVFKKRKALYDLTMFIPPNEYKEWMMDTSDLRRRRRKVPHTRLDAWKARHTSVRLLEPSMPCVSVDLPPIHHEKETSVYLHSSEDDARVDKVVITSEVEVQIPECMRSPVGEQIPIAPGTPTTIHLNPLRSHEKIGAVAEADILKPTSSVETESMVNLSSPHEALEHDAVFENEINSPEGDCNETDIYSARTRTIEQYLLKNLVEKKIREEDEVLNLSQLTAGRTKKESATLFYEILVLKTGECISVEQDTAYGDILVRQVEAES